MSRSPRTGSCARTAAGALLALLLTACTGTPDQPGDDTSSPAASPEETATSAAPASPPARGACYDLDFAQATASSVTAEPVDCSDPHTALTVHVTRTDAPGSVDTARACNRRVDRFLGGDREARRLSRFAAVWFTPTEDEQAAGAQWVRCDVVAVESREKLSTLPAPRVMRGILDRPRGRRFDLCATAAPGSDGFERVVCARPHRWRAIATLRVPARRGDAYPGQRAARDAGLDRCRRTARASVQADRVRFGWEWPTAEQWEAGQRYGYCWVPRRN